MTMATLLDQAVCAEVGGSHRVLVVGVGDEEQHDDGVGPAVVRLLCERSRGRFRIRTVLGSGEELRTRWGRSDLAAIVLPARHESNRPGVIHMVATELPRGRSQPDVTLSDRLAGLPYRVVVYTVEGANFEVGAGLSADVEMSVKLLADHIECQIAALRPDRHPLPGQGSEPGRNVIGWRLGPDGRR